MSTPKPIVVVDYDPTWPEQFSMLENAIWDKLGSLALAIEHVGSTSVPGLAAKPVIDLDVVIESIGQLPVVISLMRELGYRHEGDKGIAGREAFRYEGGEAKPTHHLYVCTQENTELKRHLLFRDRLRERSDLRDAYSRLKQELAVSYRNDRVAYTDAKTDFICSVLDDLTNESL